MKHLQDIVIESLLDDEDENTLIIPFRAMDGLGENVATGVVEERERQPFMSIEDLQKRGHISKTLIEKMQAMGILDGMGEQILNNLSTFESHKIADDLEKEIIKKMDEIYLTVIHVNPI